MIAVGEKQGKKLAGAELAQAVRAVKQALREGRPVQELADEVEGLSGRLELLKESSGRFAGVQLSPYMMWALVRSQRGRSWGG